MEPLMGKTAEDKLSEANCKICALEQELVDADTKLVETNNKLELELCKNWILEQNKFVTIHKLKLPPEITIEKLEDFRGVCAVVLHSSMYRQQFTSEFEEIYNLFSTLTENIEANHKLNNKKEQ